MWYYLILLATAITFVESTHFQGGTITWKPLDKSAVNGSSITIRITQTYMYRFAAISCTNADIASQTQVNLAGRSDFGAMLNCLLNCTTSGGYVPIPMTGYYTDCSASLGLTVGQRSDLVTLSANAYFTVVFNSSSWRTLALFSNNGGNAWSITCLIDLRLRPDGLINTPPVATMVSPIFIPVNTTYYIAIPTIDADNDYVKCRFASGTECADVCPPASLPAGTTILPNCTLIITGTHAGDYFVAALQAEDFLDTTSTTPFSSVPIQFLIYIYSPPTCPIPPLLYSSTAVAGSCVGAQVVAQNNCDNTTTILDIGTQSFPIVTKGNLTQNSSTIWYMALTWIPEAAEVGSQVLCAVAIDRRPLTRRRKRKQEEKDKLKYLLRNSENSESSTESTSCRSEEPISSEKVSIPIKELIRIPSRNYMLYKLFGKTKKEPPSRTNGGIRVITVKNTDKSKAKNENVNNSSVPENSQTQVIGAKALHNESLKADLLKTTRSDSNGGISVIKVESSKSLGVQTAANGNNQNSETRKKRCDTITSQVSTSRVTVINVNKMNSSNQQTDKSRELSVGISDDISSKAPVRISIMKEKCMESVSEYMTPSKQPDGTRDTYQNDKPRDSHIMADVNSANEDKTVGSHDTRAPGRISVVKVKRTKSISSVLPSSMSSAFTGDFDSNYENQQNLRIINASKILKSALKERVGNRSMISKLSAHGAVVTKLPRSKSISDPPTDNSC
ncbi:unnamed protein product [Didymodactylos carnosus]|uniref:Uncharacterized protein n=1 Tax=Didymodactylos carnosus TaxID=1234261 RepID=A0A8S2MNB5_9BILA|nr:unnamed protein product [Didymodactylos carnosus]